MDDDYANHLKRKLAIALAISIVRTKPKNITNPEYIQDLRNKINERHIEIDDISLRSEDFIIDTEVDFDQYNKATNNNDTINPETNETQVSVVVAENILNIDTDINKQLSIDILGNNADEEYFHMNDAQIEESQEFDIENYINLSKIDKYNDGCETQVFTQDLLTDKNNKTKEKAHNNENYQFNDKELLTQTFAQVKIFEINTQEQEYNAHDTHISQSQNIVNYNIGKYIKPNNKDPVSNKKDVGTNIINNNTFKTIDRVYNTTNKLNNLKIITFEKATTCLDSGFNNEKDGKPTDEDITEVIELLDLDDFEKDDTKLKSLSLTKTIISKEYDAKCHKNNDTIIIEDDSDSLFSFVDNDTNNNNNYPADDNDNQQIDNILDKERHNKEDKIIGSIPHTTLASKVSKQCHKNNERIKIDDDNDSLFSYNDTDTGNVYDSVNFYETNFTNNEDANANQVRNSINQTNSYNDKYQESSSPTILQGNDIVIQYNKPYSSHYDKQSNIIINNTKIHNDAISTNKNFVSLKTDKEISNSASNTLRTSNKKLLSDDNDMQHDTNNDNTKMMIENNDSSIIDTKSQETSQVPFKILEELNRVKSYLKRNERISIDGYSTDSGYRSDSQSLFRSSQTNEKWLSQSVFCILDYFVNCPILVTTSKLLDDIADILSNLINKMHQDQNYPHFLDKILEISNGMLEQIYKQNGIYTKADIIHKFLLINKSIHLIRYSLDKILIYLNEFHTNITSEENLYELNNIQGLENMADIFNVLYIILQRYINRNITTYNTPEVIKKNCISDIWKKKWDANFNKNETVVPVQSADISIKIVEVLNKIILECIDSYSLISFAALQCYNLLQD